MGYFHALKLAFLSSLIRKYMLWEGFYHDFSTKKVSASGGFAPWPPPRGSAPWTPEVTLPPLTIYPGAAPVHPCVHLHIQVVPIPWVIIIGYIVIIIIIIIIIVLFPHPIYPNCDLEKCMDKKSKSRNTCYKNRWPWPVHLGTCTNVNTAEQSIVWSRTECTGQWVRLKA